MALKGTTVNKLLSHVEECHGQRYEVDWTGPRGFGVVNAKLRWSLLTFRPFEIQWRGGSSMQLLEKLLCGRASPGMDVCQELSFTRLISYNIHINYLNPADEKRSH